MKRPEKKKKKPSALPDFVAKRQAALVAYVENLYPRPKSVQDITRAVAKDARMIAKLSREAKAQAEGEAK